jgi:hypothetical protein
MGTTLTGTTPQDTYDSLIKVTDNGPLSGTAKYLSDGLGNDSILALSTAAVGIGTNNPVSELQVGKTSDVVIAMSNSSSVTSGNRGTLAFFNSGNSTVAIIRAAAVTDNVGTELQFHTRPVAGSVTQQMTITSAGNVGIGTDTPASKLAVQGEIRSNDTGGYAALLASTALGYSIVADTHTGGGIAMFTEGSERARFTTNGLTFNGDTAAANALDDYEEGTWTMGIAFGGASVGVTTTNNTGTYTKIGRQVTVNGVLTLSSKGSSSGTATVTGLPFTIGNSNPNFASASLWLINISFVNQFQAYGNKNTTTIVLTESTSLGTVTDLSEADFANNSEVMVNFTYFV